MHQGGGRRQPLPIPSCCGGAFHGSFHLAQGRKETCGRGSFVAGEIRLGEAVGCQAHVDVDAGTGHVARGGGGLRDDEISR